MTVRIYSHGDCLEHHPGDGHAESPDRLRAVLNTLRSSYLRDELEFFEAPLAEDSHILLAHSTRLLKQLQDNVPTSGYIDLDADTVVSPGSLQAARRGVGAVCQAAEDLMAGRTETVFCAIRPPGHHATPDRAMGFCLFNNIAIAALYARQALGAGRVAILDFDVHHGNGTQDIIGGRDGLLFISTHQSPLYPGTGLETDNIPGNILNIPLSPGTRGDRFRRVIENDVLPVLHDFSPQLLLVSAGFDAHRADPLASLALEEQDYQWLGRKLRAFAREHCEGRLLAALEGGYNLEVLGSSAEAFIDGLMS